LNQLINVPNVERVYFGDDGDFNIELGWFADAQLSLQHRTDLSMGDWESVDSFNQSDTGEAVLTLSHTASGSQAFYRVLEE